MVTKDDIASFIGRLDGGAATAKEVEDGLWVVDAGDGTEVVVHYADPVAILRVRVMEGGDAGGTVGPVDPPRAVYVPPSAGRTAMPISLP